MFSHTSSDAHLWEAIREDDVQAFAALFNRYWARMHHAACSLHKDPEVCATLIHDIFLNLWLKRHQLEVDSFPRYLMAATRYHAYRHGRTARIVPLHYSEDLAVSAATSRNTGEEQLHSHELEQRVAAYLAQLPKRCQEIFWLSRREQLSGDEIAARLGISKRTVENQITHALHHLKLSLKDLLVVLFLLGTW